METPDAGLCLKEHFPVNAAEAVEKLMASYGSSVLRTAYFYLADRHLAEDVSQEVFIRVFRAWAKFEGKSSVKTWLTKITVNLCRDKLRQYTRTEGLNDPLAWQRQQPIATDQIAERLTKTAILHVVLSLPLPYQEVIYYYYYQDFSTREIGEVTGATEGTVRSRLHRARELLRERLQKEGLDE